MEKPLLLLPYLATGHDVDPLFSGSIQLRVEEGMTYYRSAAITVVRQV